MFYRIGFTVLLVVVAFGAGVVTDRSCPWIQGKVTDHGCNCANNHDHQAKCPCCKARPDRGHHEKNDCHCVKCDCCPACPGHDGHAKKCKCDGCDCCAACPGSKEGREKSREKAP